MQVRSGADEWHDVRGENDGGRVVRAGARGRGDVLSQRCVIFQTLGEKKGGREAGKASLRCLYTRCRLRGSIVLTSTRGFASEAMVAFLREDVVSGRKKRPRKTRMLFSRMRRLYC